MELCLKMTREKIIHKYVDMVTHPHMIRDIDLQLLPSYKNVHVDSNIRRKCPSLMLLCIDSIGKQAKNIHFRKKVYESVPKEIVMYIEINKYWKENHILYEEDMCI